MTLLTPGPTTFPHPNIRLTDRIRFSRGAILVARFYRKDSLVSARKGWSASRMLSARVGDTGAPSPKGITVQGITTMRTWGREEWQVSRWNGHR
jgi:hypothetical protein